MALAHTQSTMATAFGTRVRTLGGKTVRIRRVICRE
jgi:hypothetical protein